MRTEYGSIVPRRSRDHIRVVPLRRAVCRNRRFLRRHRCRRLYPGPGLGGALCGEFRLCTNALAFAPEQTRQFPIHHLEGHLLSPLLADDKPEFPFVALLVSGGHTRIYGGARHRRRYTLLGESVDDAAGESIRQNRQTLGAALPRRRELSELAKLSSPGAPAFPLYLHSHDLQMSFSGFENRRADRRRKSPCRKRRRNSRANAQRHLPRVSRHGDRRPRRQS